jgi:uncharacterized LabA/DUF88 family protein
MERVVAYIDGFNLYFGMKQKKWRRYYWLDVTRLCARLILSTQTLVRTKYFTAVVSTGADGKHERQQTYLEALGTIPDLEIIHGHYLTNEVTCRSCRAVDHVPKEKMTDVNIAVELLKDAFQDRFDVALLISADSDLTPPLRAIRELFPEKKVLVAFPPERRSRKLETYAHSISTIGRGLLAKNQLPEEIVKPDGFKLCRPPWWR